MVWLKKILKTILTPVIRWREERRLKKKIEEMRKRDPFIYK